MLHGFILIISFVDYRNPTQSVLYFSTKWDFICVYILNAYLENFSHDDGIINGWSSFTWGGLNKFSSLIYSKSVFLFSLFLSYLFIHFMYGFKTFFIFCLFSVDCRPFSFCYFHFDNWHNLFFPFSVLDINKSNKFSSYFYFVFAVFSFIAIFSQIKNENENESCLFWFLEGFHSIRVIHFCIGFFTWDRNNNQIEKLPFCVCVIKNK